MPQPGVQETRQRALEKHLQGHHTVGVYPLLVDGTCWFLALDFDARTWRADVRAVRDACTHLAVPVYVEKSRSGQGAHIWLFFSEPVRAEDARALGRLLLAQAKQARPSLALGSFDRMFPSQDSIPQGGFGNLIALPLQRAPRDLGNSVFLDQNLEPFPDEQQWDVLAKVVRVDGKRVLSLLNVAPSADTTRANRMPASSGARELAPRWHTGDLFANVDVAPKQLALGRDPMRSEELRSVEVVVSDRVIRNTFAKRPRASLHGKRHE